MVLIRIRIQQSLNPDLVDLDQKKYCTVEPKNENLRSGFGGSISSIGLLELGLQYGSGSLIFYQRFKRHFLKVQYYKNFMIY
jgi:hypothetical protein